MKKGRKAVNVLPGLMQRAEEEQWRKRGSRAPMAERTSATERIHRTECAPESATVVDQVGNNEANEERRKRPPRRKTGLVGL